MTTKELLNKYGRAELGIDGNAAFALIGDLPTGEAEFVEIVPTLKEMEQVSLSDKLRSCKQALFNLKQRLHLDVLPFYFGNSHPYGTD